jgi:glycosyltransferase involved in cell wall biosynthesis
VIKEAGHELILLTLTERGPLHEAMENRGIATYSHVLVRKRSTPYFVSHARYLARFCKQHRVDVVWSQLQEGNIIAVLAQSFLKAKLVTFRHHAESAFYAEFGEALGMKRSKGEAFLDRIINRLAKTIVVPSSGVWVCLEKYEHVNMDKVVLLPYIYDFSTYASPDQQKVQSLREQYACQLLLIMVSRLIPSKQHKPVFETVRALVAEGLSVKMIVMDDGPLREELAAFITEHGLQDHIFMIGFKEDFVNYMAATDLLIHPSVTEASNNVAKEMGLLEKGIAVCRHVGDFDDYIEENRNGYFLDPKDLKKSIESVIRDAYQDKAKLARMGRELKNDVLKHFGDSPANRKRVLDLLEKGGN